MRHGQSTVTQLTPMHTRAHGTIMTNGQGDFPAQTLDMVGVDCPRSYHQRIHMVKSGD
jgi:hypothetical protein